MRIKEVPSNSEINIWLKDYYSCKLQLDKNHVPYYIMQNSGGNPDFKSFVGKVVSNDTENLNLHLDVSPLGSLYLARPSTYTGSLILPYATIKIMRVLSNRSEYPPINRYNSSRTLIDGLTYRTAEMVVLAW